MKKRILLLFVLILIVVYILMLYSTNSIIKDFHNIVNNNIQENVSYGKLERYKIPSFENREYKNTNAKIRRNFVLHNFRRGIIYIKYSYIAYDVNDIVITGSSKIYSKWYIEKVNGRWIVVDIKEKP